MSELKGVATNKNNLKEEILQKFCLLIKKAASTRQSKTCLQHINRLVEFIEHTSIFDNLRFKWAKEKEEGESRLLNFVFQNLELKDKKLLIQYREPFKMIKDTSLAGKCPGMCRSQYSFRTFKEVRP